MRYALITGAYAARLQYFVLSGLFLTLFIASITPVVSTPQTPPFPLHGGKVGVRGLVFLQPIMPAIASGRS